MSGRPTRSAQEEPRRRQAGELAPTPTAADPSHVLDLMRREAAWQERDEPVDADGSVRPALDPSIVDDCVEALRETGQQEMLGGFLARAVDLFPEDRSLLIQRAAWLCAHGNAPAARDLLERAEREPHDGPCDPPPARNFLLPLTALRLGVESLLPTDWTGTLQPVGEAPPAPPRPSDEDLARAEEVIRFRRMTMEALEEEDPLLERLSEVMQRIRRRR